MTEATTDTVLPDAVTADEVARLRDEVAQKERELQYAQRRASAIRTEAEEIIAAIYDQAEKRGWCSEYETDFARPLNDRLTHLELPVREQEYEVQWEETFTVTVHRSTRVTAVDEDSAIDAARDYEQNTSADDSEIEEAVQNGNYSYESSDNFEIA